MKKIVWITSDFFIDVDIHVLTFLKEKYEIVWLIPFSKKRTTTYNLDDINNFCLENKIEYQVYDLKYRYRNLKIIGIYYQIIKEIKKQNPDIIYLNFAGLVYFIPLLHLLIKNVTKIIAIHDVISHVGANSLFMKIHRIFIFKYINNFHVYSKTQLECFKKKYKHKNVFYAPLFMKNFGNSFSIPPKDLIHFLFFGLIRHNKGLEYLIEAANNLAKKYEKLFKITIAGNTDNWDFYEKLIDNKNVFDLKIGVIDNKEIPELFCTSHYLVLPYRDITQSGPLLISYNYNIPVIASNLDGFKEYIQDKHNGFLFETENSLALLQVMENIILSKNTGYKEIKDNLTHYVKNNISVEFIIEQYKTIFDSF
jgi:glycosyltransferase involved in cell wall biosynthesis